MYAHVGRNRFLTQKAKENKEAISWEVRSQYRDKPIDGSVGLRIALYWPTARNHDIDNNKALIDSCTGILWYDDGQITDLHLTKAIDRDNPRVEMWITSLAII
jgi:Holliday junction resolvase RusA-like endonuclease